MSRPDRRPAMTPSRSAPGETCPHWCVADHGLYLEEDDFVHLGEPVALADGLLARLCLSVDPRTGANEGRPYVLMGWSEYTVDEAAALGAALIAMAREGSDVTRP